MTTGSKWMREPTGKIPPAGTTPGNLARHATANIEPRLGIDLTKVPARQPEVHALSSPGSPLESRTMAAMESRFGHDFGDVRIHLGATADESARAQRATAYTVGSDVVFREGAYRPGTSEGDSLIAHELAHVVQQRGGDTSGTALPTDATEADAHKAAHAWASGGSIDVTQQSPVRVARQDEDQHAGTRDQQKEPKGERTAGLNASSQVLLGNQVTASAGPAERQRAHKLVQAVDELLTQYVSDVDSKASRWNEPAGSYVVGVSCREVQHFVKRMEVVLRTGETIPRDGWTKAIGAFSMAQRYLERLVEPDGPIRVGAARRALERAARLVPAPPEPKPLSAGLHPIVDPQGRLVGYVNVLDSSHSEYFDTNRRFVEGVETPIQSEGLGPLDYLPLGWGLGKLGYKLSGALWSALARRLTTAAVRRTFARSVVIAGTMKGVARAAPVVAGEVAEHAFILSETLSAEAFKAEARAVAESTAAESTAGAEGSAAASAPRAASAGAGVGGPSAGAPSPGAASAVAKGAGASAAVTATTSPKYAASRGEQAEGPNLRQYHPGAHSVPPKFRAYDAYEGGTAEYIFTGEGGGPAGRYLVLNQVISGARWISLKQVLDPSAVTPDNIGRHVDKALRDMERDANDASGRKPARDPEPIDANTYLRIIKKDPARVTLHITYPGPVSAETEAAIEEAARAAVRNSGRLGDLPPFDLLLNGKSIPLD